MRIFLLLFILGTAISSFGQNTGLYGKRTIVEVNSCSNFPLFNRLVADNYYKKDGTNLVSAKNPLDYGFRVSVLRAFKNNVATGIEYSKEFSNISGPYYADLDYPDGSEYGVSLLYENLHISTNIFMFKFEFSGKSDLLPIGLSHQIGFAFTSTKVKERDYLYLYDYDPTYNGQEPIQQDLNAALMDYDYRFKGGTFMYEMHVKTPVSRSVTINYGFRYNLNIVSPKYKNVNSNSQYIADFNDMRSRVFSNRLFSVINFNLGVGYAF